MTLVRELEIAMDTYEKIGYTCLGVVALIYLAVLAFAGFQVGWIGGTIGLLVVLGVGVLLLKVVKERVANKEDDYYAGNIDK